MKTFNYLVLVLFLTCNCMPSQSAIPYRQANSGDSTEFFCAKKLNTLDSISFKKLCDSLHYRKFIPFSKPISQNTINSKIFENLKYTPLPKQRVYFSIHDYTAGPHMTRVSQYENPYFDNAKQLRFLWSGHVIPYAEIGAPENYLRTNQQPPLIIKFIRGSKGLKGIWIEQLQPEFHHIP